MPELPEVETLCRQLQTRIAGKEISSTEVYDEKLSGIENISGKKVSGVQRKSKTIGINLDDGTCIDIHLRMTGRLLWTKEEVKPKHSRWMMKLVDGSVYLIDSRRFATIKRSRQEKDEGENDLLKDFNVKEFLAKNSNRKGKIKNLLMDQQIIAGIGNIYACEILHRCGIHPERTAQSLKTKDWQMIFNKGKEILEKAIKNRGTSISDWRDLDGQQGENQLELKVYGRAGKKCGQCGGVIIRIKQGGRGTFFCTQCQR